MSAAAFVWPSIYNSSGIHLSRLPLIQSETKSHKLDLISYIHPSKMAPSATNTAVSDYKPKHIEDRHFINGEFVPSISGKKFDVYNPATEKLAASVYEAGAEDVDVAVKAAKAAFPAWSALGADVRAGYLNKLADAIEKNIDEISYTEAITMGKPFVGDSKGSSFKVQFTQLLPC